MPDKRIRPRALTLTLPDIKQPHLILGDDKYILRNFSEEGIGLWMPTSPPFPSHRGHKMKGDIEIGQHIYPVTLEVVHFSNHVVGLKITHTSKELAKIFHDLLQPAVYAGQLELHPKSGTEDTQSGYPRLWFVGPGASELVVWYSSPQGMIQTLQLSWLGKWVSRELLKPVTTGWMKDTHPPGMGRRFTKEDPLIEHPLADADILQEAAQFLSAVPKPLPGHLLWQFLETGEQVYLKPEIIKNFPSKAA